MGNEVPQGGRWRERESVRESFSQAGNEDRGNLVNEF